MTADQALEAWESAKSVESAYRFQAKKAQRAYISAARTDPRAVNTDRLFQLHLDALGQWAQAQRDAAAARTRWVNRCRAEGVSLHRSAAGAPRGAYGPSRARNGSRSHLVAVRPGGGPTAPLGRAT